MQGPHVSTALLTRFSCVRWVVWAVRLSKMYFRFRDLAPSPRPHIEIFEANTHRESRLTAVREDEGFAPL